MKQYNKDDRMHDPDIACESSADYSSAALRLDDFFKSTGELNREAQREPLGLAPIIKWPGGKEKELKHIFPHLPAFDRYFEPFVGGGAVFMAVNSKHCFINDRSHELISLYEYIANSNPKFFEYATAIDETWEKAHFFFESNPGLIELYLQYRNEHIDKDSLKAEIKDFCTRNKQDILTIISHFKELPTVLLKELETNLFRKMTRMRQLEIQKHILPDSDLRDNIETAIKSAVYMNFRYLYNHPDIKRDKELHTAMFFFIRNYAYGGMFRYSGKGDFNVPYDGIAYNGKRLKKKLDYYCSREVRHHFQNARIYNLDFEQFLEESRPTADDFVFLDPPYDSEFSTYAQNAFTRADQERLADYMINRCAAKWMLVIKNTDFIYNLYRRPGINIRSFAKSYTASFMNRNDKNATHLIITNY